MPGEVRDGQGGPGEGCGLWALNSRFWILGPVLWALGSGLWFWTVVLGSGLLALGSGSGSGLQNLGSRLWALGSGLLALSPGLWAPDSGHTGEGLGQELSIIFVSTNLSFSIFQFGPWPGPHMLRILIFVIINFPPSFYEYDHGIGLSQNRGHCPRQGPTP